MNSPPDANKGAAAKPVNPYQAPKTMDPSRSRWLWIAFGVALLFAAVASAGVVTWSVMAIKHVQRFDDMRRGPPPRLDREDVQPTIEPEAPPEPAN